MTLVQEKLGNDGLDLIINNAGIMTNGKLLQVTNEDMIRVYQTNVIGPLNVVQVQIIHRMTMLYCFKYILNVQAILQECKHKNLIEPNQY